jgi:2-deoxy-D-gluconate 3-dehydrogenase
MGYLEDLFSLEGKTAIVTGASRGLGRGIAKALNGAGANVVLSGRTANDLEETKKELPVSEKALVIPGDVNDRAYMTYAFDKASEKFGRVDILVNNAGIIRRSPAETYFEKDWDDVIATNLKSAFLWSQESGKRMIASGGGKIINIASVTSFSGSVNVVAYASSKGGMSQMTKALANEWAKHHVNVNAIAPGFFITDATSALRANPERSTHVFSRIPAGRWGMPDDLAGAVIFLASKASDYVHGHILSVDGGWNSY